MSTSREIEPHHHRPVDRRLVDLSNEELERLFTLRSSKISDALKHHTFWENNKIVYWGQFVPLQAALYEVMLEIQSRYPAEEMYKGYQDILNPMFLYEI